MPQVWLMKTITLNRFNGLRVAGYGPALVYENYHIEPTFNGLRVTGYGPALVYENYCF